MPAFNAEKTIAGSIDSILRQSFTDFELLIIDDCSSDRTPEIIEHYRTKDPRVRVIRLSRNSGVVKALNIGISKASGKYIARMDADDESLPDRLKLQVAFLDSNPEVVLVGGPYVFMGRFRMLDVFLPTPQTNEGISAVIERINPICHPTVMFRKSAFDEVGGYREAFANSEDYDLWLRLSRVHKLANLAEPLVRYRLSSGGVTIKKKREMLRFHHLAVKSHFMPETPLDSLMLEVESELDPRLEISLRNDYLDLIRKLFRLGHPLSAMRLFLKLVEEIGIKRTIFLGKEREKSWDAELTGK